ncbi:hypothetical protein PsorP6_003922 [Peronosclerospora sorghi]|uniref:Uncharacterized protein n=1 Tax=Peronosclerospora sorghi TaxID=230839 RepID=A0ACC0VSR7_9STRA|nr:hypothetical protein PsorP6_003922 [Peronosclerospora sorghi]
MIEWYKQYCREFCAEEGIITSKAARKRRKRAKIKDLRENMVVSVLCKLRKMNDIASTNKGRGSGTLSDLDGVLLKELVMFDSVGEGMIVNLWDQHAEKRFVTRLLEHRGAVEINGVVISLQALSNRLVANTTPHTTFNLFDLDDPESIEIEKRVATNFRVRPSFTVATSPAVFYTLEELLNSSVVGLATLKNIRVEQICLDRNLGKQALVLAKFTPRLAEKFCTRCNQTLPERLCHDSMDPPHYEACTNRCKIRRGSETNALCAWRYRRFSMTLRDSKNERLSVEVDNQATAEIVGNIEARHLVEGQCDASPSCQFDPTSAVASLLNALAEDVDQTFEAQLMCSSANESHEASQTFGSTHDSSHGEAVVLQRVFSLLSFAPGDAIVL